MTHYRGPRLGGQINCTIEEFMRPGPFLIHLEGRDLVQDQGPDGLLITFTNYTHCIPLGSASVTTEEDPGDLWSIYVD